MIQFTEFYRRLRHDSFLLNLFLKFYWFLVKKISKIILKNEQKKYLVFRILSLKIKDIFIYKYIEQNFEKKKYPFHF